MFVFSNHYAIHADPLQQQGCCFDTPACAWTTLSICTDKANPFHVPVHRPTFFATGLPFVMPPPLSCNNLYSDPPPARICSTHHLAAPQPSTQMHLQLRDNKLDTLVTVWHTSKAFPAHRGSGVTLISQSTSPCFSYFQSTQT